jgi:hypothetical protein
MKVSSKKMVSMDLLGGNYARLMYKKMFYLPLIFYKPSKFLGNLSERLPIQRSTLKFLPFALGPIRICFNLVPFFLLVDLVTLLGFEWKSSRCVRKTASVAFPHYNSYR